MRHDHPTRLGHQAAEAFHQLNERTVAARSREGFVELEAGLGLRLPATLIWAHPTLDALTGHLAGLLSIAEVPAALDDVPADIRHMDAAATAAALDRELAEVLNGTGGADG